ncbi:g1237 [Coccomyxa elongata]
MWSGSSGSQGARGEVAGTTGKVGNCTPFTDFVLSRLPDEESQKLFALSFGEHLRRDADALEIDFDEVFKWLGIDRKDSALRLLRREFSSAEYVSHIDVGNSGAGAGRPRDVYKISFNQFEELMIAAQTAEGKKARKLVLHLKKILQDYIIAEQTELKKTALAEQERLKMVAIAEQARQTAKEAGRANALQLQLEGLRSQQQHLYAFRLFGNRFKCGISKDMAKREAQHRTTCPSGDMVHSVPITCKAMEKVFESVMRSRGTWVRAEEYEFTCSEEEIKIMFEVFARAEEVLRATPISEYRKLLGVLDSHLGRTTSVASSHGESPRVKDAQDVDLESVKKFVSEHIEITEDLGDRLKGAEIYKAYQETASEGDAVMKDKPFYRRLKVALADNHNGLRGRDVAYEGVRLS